MSDNGWAMSLGKTVDHIPKQHFTGHLMENGNEEDQKQRGDEL